MRASAKKSRGDTGEAVACGEHGFAAGDMVAEPTAEIRGAGIEDVMQRVEADGDASGATRAVVRHKQFCGVENQQGVGEIAGAEHANGHQQAAERLRQSFKPEKERARRLWP